MIISRTPFRLSLGGGSTDLPSYYEKYGGFIFAVAINLYFDVIIRKIHFDDRIGFRYSRTERVKSWKKLKHEIGNKVFEMVGWNEEVGIDVSFTAETLSGTGLGSSASFTIGLLNALYAFKGQQFEQRDLAEKAFEITQRLGWSDGKQDSYVVALGGFVVLEIANDGKVTISRPQINPDTVKSFINNTTFWYTGEKRSGSSDEILKIQDKKRILELKHRIKEIGRKILTSFESGDLSRFGNLLDEHWQIKKEMSEKISNQKFDNFYELAKTNGALGGKLIGAGGGGYFIFYCDDSQSKAKVVRALDEAGLKRIPLGIDYEGTRVNNFDF